MTVDQSPQVAVVMVPLPPQGHLNMLLHLSRIISAYNVPVYFTATTNNIHQAKHRLQGWDPSCTPNVHFHEFPETPFENPPPDPKFPSHHIPSLLATKNLRQPVYAFIDRLSKMYRRVVVIYDCLMSYVVQDVGAIDNAEGYVFYTTSCFQFCASAVSTWSSLPPEAKTSSEVPNWSNLPPEAKILEGIPSIDDFRPENFMEFLLMQYHAKKFNSGEIFNSNRLIDGFFLDLMSKRKNIAAESIFAIGPFNPMKTPDQRSDHRCLDWLDKQEPDSVIYLSFGSTSSFTEEQIAEIATGLERSEHRFIWVLRDADRGNIFTGDERKMPLPTGFEERVGGRGIVVRDWAPQLEILGHPSTGGFVTHCGWNSCLEAITMGVPVATWPMNWDQPPHAVQMTEALRIGVQMRPWTGDREALVSSSRVEMVVRELMGSEEGDVIRRRARELGEAVRSSMMEGGSTRKEIESFIDHISR